MNRNVKRRVNKFVSVLLLSSMICAGPAVMYTQAAGKDTGSDTKTVAYADSSVVDKKVSLDEVHGVAGMAVNLDSYYEAIASDTVSGKLELEVKTIVDEKASVLEDYKKLGIADVKSSNYLNVRKKPSTDAEICGKMTQYTACDIVKKDGDWYKIKSGSVTGYVYAEYIITGEKAQEIALEQAEKMAVVTTDSNLNVRKKPSTDSSIITKISTEERYEVQSVKNGWVKISLDGLTDEEGDELDSVGYISADYCEVKYALKSAVKYTPLKEGGGSTAYSSTRASLCNYACQFVGNPYVWGGTSLTNGADCSGFVMSVFAKYGVYLPHSSSGQSYCGTRVSSSQMRPGDLVFYGSGGINHVAIYIGDGMIVHAANTRRGIVINSWNYMTPVKIVNVLGN
ncbi:MAG: NlpC/P60 family protein [Lachnospiraceae bacterium]|nr:NlpC/P60 family protein [Lachnospiraceae bacterium]